ncbi:chemotaxis protein CheD [Alkalicoccus chagannorensis]|uniref:chemotaxis protein CheD n=1 Tax=Alkalicoccus chagannorensis TaxID=427072 RepID=UPI00047B22F0|nr:chemotaxis protein CheD [Alkalicoccus chagannorensis]
MNNIIKVGMADLQCAVPPSTLRTSGLGSCVGIIIYDALKKTAVMAHIMLPDSAMAKDRSFNRSKYADTAVEDMISCMKKKGSPLYSLKAKMAGGAQMFQFSSSSESMRIGPRNADAVRQLLRQHRIEIVFEDTGGSSGRTIEFDPSTSVLEIRTVNKGVVQV